MAREEEAIWQDAFLSIKIPYISIYTHMVSSKVYTHMQSIETVVLSSVRGKEPFPWDKGLNFWLTEGKLLSYIILSISLSLTFSRESIRIYSSKRTEEGISLADLPASLVFHPLSRQCDPAKKPKSILVYYCSQTVTLSQSLSESFALFLI